MKCFWQNWLFGKSTPLTNGKRAQKAAQNAGRTAWFQRAKRLCLERLEDRIVPTILFTPYYGFESTTPRGGYTLSSAPVFLEFWGGTYWNSAAGSNQENQIINAAQNLFASPYFANQAQYNTDGIVSYGNAINYNTDPANGFSIDQIETVITTAIDNSNGAYFPRPDSTPHEPLYVVITPPGVQSSQFPEVGYNTLDPNHHKEVFAWVGGGTSTATNFVLDEYTKILSQEVSEAITSPGGCSFGFRQFSWRRVSIGRAIRASGRG